MRVLLVPLLSLSACHSQTTHDRLANDEQLTLNATGAVVDFRRAPPAAKAGKLEANDALLTASLEWSAEVAATPKLLAALKADFAKQQTEMRKTAADDRRSSIPDKREFHAYDLTLGYRTEGQSLAVLSLSEDWSDYSGGAHPNHGTRGLLWDRAVGKQIKVIALFASPASRETLLKAPFCAALDEERDDRRGGEKDQFFSACPALDEIALIPADKDHDGRFETLILHADPYVAGPYAEGDYDIELPVTPALVAALKPAWRTGFAAKR